MSETIESVQTIDACLAFFRRFFAMPDDEKRRHHGTGPRGAHATRPMTRSSP